MEELPFYIRFIRDSLWSIGIIQYKIELLKDNPASSQIKDRILYVVGTKAYAKWAYIKCPSNCGEVIMLGLNEKKSPSWKVTQDWIGRPSLHPSIHKLDGCKSHFWLRSGSLEWV